MTVDVKTIKVGDKFQKYIRMQDGTDAKDGIIECVGFEKSSILLKYTGTRRPELDNQIVKYGKAFAQRVVFGFFLGATRL